MLKQVGKEAGELVGQQTMGGRVSSDNDGMIEMS